MEAYGAFGLMPAAALGQAAPNYMQGVPVKRAVNPQSSASVQHRLGNTGDQKVGDFAFAFCKRGKERGAVRKRFIALQGDFAPKGARSGVNG